MGVVDAMAPRPTTERSTAVVSGRRAAGTQSELALIADIRDPATPRPIMPRASTSSPRDCAWANSTAPAVATISMGPRTLRGPTWSRATAALRRATRTEATASWSCRRACSASLRVSLNCTDDTSSYSADLHGSIRSECGQTFGF